MTIVGLHDFLLTNKYLEDSLLKIENFWQQLTKRSLNSIGKFVFAFETSSLGTNNAKVSNLWAMYSEVQLYEESSRSKNVQYLQKLIKILNK